MHHVRNINVTAAVVVAVAENVVHMIMPNNRTGSVAESKMETPMLSFVQCGGLPDAQVSVWLLFLLTFAAVASFER